MPFALIESTITGSGIDAVFQLFTQIMTSMGTAMSTLIAQPLFLLGVAGGLVFTIIKIVKRVTRG